MEGKRTRPVCVIRLSSSTVLLEGTGNANATKTDAKSTRRRVAIRDIR